MKKTYQYKCTLLSDVILTSMASTEGYKESLNYIPGAKFMGIVARKLYDETASQKTLDLFHNGTVRFGDASPMIEGKPTFKIPFSWYYEKGKKLSDQIYIHHNLIDKLEESNLQLKQAREGSFSVEQAQFVTLEQDFSIKSAYDPEKRRSKDSQMFGYFSLKKGTTWAFSVEDTNGQYAENIKSILVGKHKIGKSKSAEYGLVQIDFVSANATEIPVSYQNEVIIYAKSNLCFYNDFGQCTAMPSVEQLVGTTNAEIIWAKSQVRSRNYQTWNRKRNNRDTDRFIIEGGSVFFVKLKEVVTSSFFEQGLGFHKNEGFGQVIINPNFLVSETETLLLSLQKGTLSTEKYYAYEGSSEDELVSNWLKNRQTVKSFDFEIDKKVNQFISDTKTVFQNSSKSQWGALRNYAKNATSVDMFKTLVFHEKLGFVYRGKSETEWRKNGSREKLKLYLETLPPDQYLPFVVKLSTQMAKKE